MAEVAIEASRGREVATVLVALGRETAARLLAHFEPDEVAALRSIGAASGGSGRLPNVTAGELDAIVDRFERAFEAGPGVVGANTSFAAILAESTGDELEPNTENTFDPHATLRAERWDQVGKLTDADLAEWMAEENEAVAALVLARLPAKRSAALIRQLSADACGPIVTALPHVEAGPAAEDLVLDMIEDALGDGSDANAGEAKQTLLAGIVNELDAETGDFVTRQLEGSMAADQMEAVRSRIFRFDDVTKLSTAARSVLLSDVSTDQLVLALNGIEADLAEAVLSSLGQRVRRMVESDLEAGLPAKPDAIREARQAVAARAIQLGKDGAIALPKPAA